YIPTVRLSVPTADVYIAKKLATIEDFALLHEDKIYSESKRREVIEFGDSYKAPPEETAKDKGPTGEVSSSTKKKGRTVAITAEDMQKRKNDVKARTTLLLALPNEHQLRFSKYDTAKALWEAILKTFDDLDTMSLDDVYNYLKVYEPEVQKRAGSDSQNMAFISSSNTSSGKSEVPTVQGASTASAQVPTVSADVEDEASKNHALVADEEEVPTEYALMAKSSSSSDNEVYDDSFCSKSCRKNTENLSTKISKLNEGLSDCETDLYNYKRVLERDTELKDSKIEYLRNELVEVNKEKQSIDFKIRNFENASKDLDRPLGSQKLDKDMKGVGFNEYCVVPPPPVQVYSPPKKDLSWMGLPELVDDTVTDCTRPTPSIDVSKSVIKEQEERWKSNHPSFFEQGGSSGNVMLKPMIKFVKESGCPNATKVNNTKNARQPTVKYAEMKTWIRVNHAQDNMKYTSTHKSMTPRAVLLKSGTKPINRPFFTARPTLKSAQPKMTSFVKTTHSNVKMPFERKSVAKNKVWSPTVRPKIPTVGSKVPTAKPAVAADKGNKGKESGCSRHMTGNISYLSKYEPFNGGYVSFVHERGNITSKGSIKTGKLEFENVYSVEELKYNLFSVSQICDNKNSILFNDTECLVLGKDFKLVDDKHMLLRTPRQQNMYTIDLKNVVPHKKLTCLIAKASVDKSMQWHRRLGHLNFKTMNKLVRSNLVKGLPSKSFKNDHSCVACLKGKQHKASCKSKLVNSVSKPLHTLHMDLFGPTFFSNLNHKWILRNFITKIENLKDLKVKIIKSDNGGEFRNKEMDEFCSRKGIKREFINVRTPQQNGVAERRNMTLIQAARTMLADAKLPVTFWAEAANTACKFDAKGDEGYFVGYSLSSKSIRVFNKRTKKIEENLHLDFLENKSIEKGTGPDWLFDIDTLTNFMNYVPVVVAGTSSITFQAAKKDDAIPDNNSPQKEQQEVNRDKEVPESSRNSNPTASSKVSTNDSFELASSSTVET
nr:hypothetical protein [Tanacetum cinerariifolium]